MEPPSLDLGAKPLDYLDVDERPPLIVKLVRSTSCPIISYIFHGQPMRVYSCVRNEIASHIKEAQ
jgi:hypothetical protein